MKNIFRIAPLVALLACPMIASADYVDVIESKLKEGCTMTKYMGIIKDFNALYTPRGYTAEILTPVYGANMETIIWVGRTKNVESFGKALQGYRDAARDANTAEGKLDARIGECSTMVARRSYNAR